MNRLSAIVISALVAMVLLAYVVGPRPEERLARQLVEQGLVTNAWDAPVMEAATFLVRGTPFEGKVRLNQTPAAGYLTILVLSESMRERESLPDGAAQLFDNCAYLGKPDTVVCDTQFLKGFLAKQGTLQYYARTSIAAAMADKFQKAFLLWTLGHEIGHALHGHGPSHFSASQFAQEVASVSVSHVHEEEADMFFARQLVTDSPRCNETMSMIETLLNVEITHKVGPIRSAGVGLIWDYNNTQIVEYSRQGTHPEYVVRGARLLYEIGKHPGYPGITGMVEPFIQQMRESKPH